MSVIFCMQTVTAFWRA